MDEQLKQRLVGAAVLILLGVIFIPLILDGPPAERPDLLKKVQQASEKAARDTPREAAPDYAFRPAPPPVKVVVGQKREAARPLPPIARTAATEKTTRPTPAKPAQRKKAVRKPQVREKPVVTRAKPQPRKSTAVPASSDRWMIQVASFGSSSNANALKNRLSRKKYPASVEAVSGAKHRVFRVLVGPIQGRKKAETMRRRIHQNFSLKGILRRHG